MLGEEGGKDAAGQHEHGDDVFLKKIESHLLTQARCSKAWNYQCQHVNATVIMGLPTNL